MRDKGKLLMLLLIGSESFFFIALLVAYVYYRNFTHVTDTVAHNLDAVRTGIFTLILIASSFTLMFSRKALFKQKMKAFKIGMGLTILLGVVFIIGQINEYKTLYEKQVTMNRDVFGSSFFTLTGFHGLHVILGIIMLTLMFGLSFGRYKTITLAGINGVDVYWHFVDVVWIFVFFFVYIIPLL